MVDPSRVAAQVVSGIGFIGGGVIFMRRDVVRGLTTAASVWLTAAIGMACGAGLPVLAVATVLGHFVIMFLFPRLMRHLPRERRETTRLRVSYQDGRGLLRTILVECTRLRFAIDQVDLERDGGVGPEPEEARDLADVEGVEHDARRNGIIALTMRVKGKRPASHLIAGLSNIDGVVRVDSLHDDAELE